MTSWLLDLVNQLALELDGQAVAVCSSIALTLLVGIVWVEWCAYLHRIEVRYQRRRMAAERRAASPWPPIAP